MIRTVLFAALAVGLVVGPGVATPVAAQQRAQIKLNLSPAGEAVAKRYLGGPDPQIQAMAKQLAEIMQQQRALVTAPRLDLARFTALMRKREQLQGQMTRRSNDRMLQLLGELNEADRIALLRGLSNPVPAPGPPAK